MLKKYFISNIAQRHLFVKNTSLCYFFKPCIWKLTFNKSEEDLAGAIRHVRCKSRSYNSSRDEQTFKKNQNLKNQQHTKLKQLNSQRK